MFKKIIDFITGYFHPGKKPRRVHEVISAKKADQLRRQKEIGREIPKPAAKPPSPVEEPSVLPKPETTEALEELTPAHIEVTGEEPTTKITEVTEETKQQTLPIVEEFRDQAQSQLAEDAREQGPSPREEIPKEPERQVVEIQAPPKEKRLINLGIDFGTSGTKVIYRDVFGKKAWVFSFDHGLKDYSTFVLPSSVRILNGKVFFGSDAERKGPRGVGIRSFKICMVCQCGFTNKENCNLFCPFSNPGSQEYSVFIDESSLLSITPADLCTLYIAYVIGLVKKSMIERFGNAYELKMTLNMGIPIDYLRNDRLDQAFNQVFYFANLLSESIENGAQIYDLLKTLDELKGKNRIVPGPEIRRTFVQPETVAAVLSYILSPMAAEGLYGIADVGAGTTDVVFFRYSRLLGERKLAVYNADSHFLGANKVDQELFNFLERKRIIPQISSVNNKNEVIQRLRNIKKMISDEERVKIVVRREESWLYRQDFEEITQRVGQEIFPKYKKTWQGAYAKEPTQEVWDFTLFRIGGGSKIAGIANQFAEKPWPHINRMTMKEIKIPSDLIFDLGGDENPDKSYELLAIAYGLSYPVAELPDVNPNVDEIVIRKPYREMPPWYHYWEQD